MARKEVSIEPNLITRDMIRRCQKCEIFKTCSIRIANIAYSPYCLYPNAEKKIYVKKKK